MKYLSVCSGIEAATVAWHPLGWEPVAFSEIDAFPSAVLAHHYRDVPNLGDMNDHTNWPDASVDVLVGGTPCQSFSVAGLRKGMADPRGNLALVYLAIADRYRPRWIVWENVPGVLSSNEGRDFGAFLGGLEELGYGWAYRVLDAQFFGVAQRRRRVFVVGYLGDWRRAAAVLFDRESVSGNPAPRRESGKDAAATVAARARGRGRDGTDETTVVSHDPGCTLTARDYKGPLPEADLSTVVAHSLTKQHGVTEDGTGQGVPLMPVAAPNSNAAGRRREDDINLVAFHNKQDPDVSGDVTHPIGAGDNGMAVAFAQNQRDEVRIMDKAGALAAEPGAKQQTYVMQERAESINVSAGPDGAGFRGDGTSYTLEARSRSQSVCHDMQVRRLTPRECERLQGFPDDYTRIPYRNKSADNCPDGPRYKALGNSMAVPVMRWIGERIDQVEKSSG